MKKLIYSLLICLCLTGCGTSVDIDKTTDNKNSNEICISEGQEEIIPEQLNENNKNRGKNDLLEQKDTDTSYENSDALYDMHIENFSKEKDELDVAYNSNNTIKKDILILNDDEVLNKLKELSKHSLRYHIGWNR